MSTKQTTTTRKATTKASPRKASNKASTKPLVSAPLQIESKPEVKTSLPTLTTPQALRVFVPSDRPSNGAALFAYTAAAIVLVAKLPRAKQFSVARVVHGATAIRHHGANGTRKITENRDGSVYYDLGYFKVGKDSTDTKRQAVPIAWVEYFHARLLGKPFDVPAGLKGCGAKNAAELTVTL